MAQMGRPGLSSQQKQELWARWKAGQSLSDIGRSLGKHAGSIFGVLLSKGGIAPPARSRSRARYLCTIARRYRAAWSRACRLRMIAAQLGRAPSTISREVGRNNGRKSIGPPTLTSALGDRPSVQSPVGCHQSSLQMVVAKKLNDHWSPQQISGWLKVEYLNDATMRVSHETIYKSLFVQARGVLRKELIRVCGPGG